VLRSCTIGLLLVRVKNCPPIHRFLRLKGGDRVEEMVVAVDALKPVFVEEWWMTHSSFDLYRSIMGRAGLQKILIYS
jgi:hypothetical protein